MLTVATETSRDLEGLVNDLYLTYRDLKGEPKLVRTGDNFEMTTDDPLARPLPNMEVLSMQWKLQRVLGMRGAAEGTLSHYATLPITPRETLA